MENNVKEFRSITKEELKELKKDDVLIYQDEELKQLSYSKFDDLTDEDLLRFGKGVLRITERTNDRTNKPYLRASLRIAENVVLKKNLSESEYAIISSIAPDLIGKDTIIGCKLVSMIVDKNIKVNKYTGVKSEPRSFACVGRICDGVYIGNDVIRDRFGNEKRTCYLDSQQVLLCKIHNAKNPNNPIKFLDLGITGLSEEV